MVSWQSGSRGRGGFLLLETVPALLLLSAVAMVAMRILSLQLSSERMAQQLSLPGRTFAAVWETWRDSGGLAALAVFRPGYGLEVLDFPDTDWLPGEVEGDPWSQCRWRRSRRRDPRGQEWWLVQYRLSGSPNWRSYGRVLIADTTILEQTEP